MDFRRWFTSRRRAALAGVALAAASALGAASAQAEVLAFTILDYPGFGGAPTVYETFDLDSSAGRQDLVPRTVYFAISNDSLGRTGAYFGGPITGNAFGTGKLQNGGRSAHQLRYFPLEQDL